jgi:iron(III) transport system substrate-binding protein
MINIAKQEGKVVYYNTMSVSEVDRLVKAFEKNYPGIAVESFRTTKEKLVSRLFAEDRAGRTLADVVSVNHAVMHLLRLKGILAKHDNPEASAYGPGFKDRDGYWTGLYGPTAVVVYNVNKVRPEERPKTYEDLLHPKWKRKMALDGSKWEWFAAQLQIMGRERGLAFMK